MKKRTALTVVFAALIVVLIGASFFNANAASTEMTTENSTVTYPEIHT